ncbi:MAG: HAD family hydrolase [Deltaproteobacteria bacterium]|nr:HAD family hydrolase [Deltaproteobacteria bacterium]MBW1938831.1 HAD family hydrolase [Deltaproteobacteria bacterium]MBW1965062.1 HAD family hydrolase [Deltaproteobacteria bacterium]MBW2350024.1 HAD family hydrolase [Deltaproteobacteria bacterium]
MNIKRAVFLDRDGTISEEVGYLRRLEDLVLIERAGSGIRLLNDSGYKVVVITNQSGVARGFFDEIFVKKVHEEMARRLSKSNAYVDRWYYCPHHPTEGRGKYRVKCGCRKPFPGMVDLAIKELGIVPEESFVVGDSIRDIEIAWRVGAKPVLVLTGYGKETLSRLLPDQKKRLPHIASDLFDACEWICEYCW